MDETVAHQKSKSKNLLSFRIAKNVKAQLRLRRGEGDREGEGEDARDAVLEGWVREGDLGRGSMTTRIGKPSPPLPVSSWSESIR